MKSNDQKQLEILYESINDNFLIKEERILIEEYTKYLAVHMIDEIKKYSDKINTNPADYFPCTMYNFFWLYLKEIPQDILAKLKLDSETTYWVHDLYETCIIKTLSHDFIDVDKNLRTGYVCLIAKSPFDEDKETIIPLTEDIDKIANELKEYFKDFIRFTFTDKSMIKKLEKEEALNTWIGKAYTWRKDRAKFSKLEKNLPELKDIF